MKVMDAIMTIVLVLSLTMFYNYVFATRDLFPSTRAEIDAFLDDLVNSIESITNGPLDAVLGLVGAFIAVLTFIFKYPLILGTFIHEALDLIGLSLGAFTDMFVWMVVTGLYIHYALVVMEWVRAGFVQSVRNI